MDDSKTTPKIKERIPPPGALGWFDNEELEKLPKYKFPSVGSIPFNTALGKMGGVLADTGEAVVDLTKWIMGVETTTPKVETGKPIYGEGNPEIIKAQSAAVEEEQDARRIQNIERWFESISKSQSIEDYKRKQEEAHRLVGATVSKDEAREMGHLDNEAISTLVDISEAQAEAEDNAKEEEKEISLAETAAKPVVDLNSFMEGGTGSGQVNITSTGGGGAG